ncbi:MAG: multifunctional CCA addition/repair protein [Xanthomonadales bacterium]|nr:multifunctional CCA addition/repair protein [Xanthomonadales bacterium]
MNKPLTAQTYLVGGAVRDELLNRPIKDRDWVVVGATPEQLLAQGFRAVGRDFPVFLHPQSHEEYALARTERKQGHGYHGFDVQFHPQVSLEEDLLRRDLTINAMAKDSSGKIIDPYGGLNDLKQRYLRHVSPAFAEDPLRVLRVARFAARYHHLGFRIAPETLELMKSISDSGELLHLAMERVWQETHKALCESHPSVFFTSLKDCHALAVLFPELDALAGVPQVAEHHPEIDTWLHTLLVLDYSATEKAEAIVRFACLVHDLGKALTPEDEWPRHIAHEERGVEPVEQLCQRLKCPGDYRDIARLVCRYHLRIHRALELRPGSLLKIFEQCDALRKPQRFIQILQACRCDARGRKGRHDAAYPQYEYLSQALKQLEQVDIKTVLLSGKKGAEIGQAIRHQRLSLLTQFVQQQR